jgi:uncharacterized tellurite resistance protein B-like protein
MIDRVMKFFGKDAGPRPSEASVDTVHDIQVAACALFLEMANIDGEFDEQERGRIISILERHFSLSSAHAADLIAASKEELEGSIDLWQFTNLINQNYSREEKIQIIETIWELAYIDGKLDKHEDYLLHKLANLLRLSHKQLIEAKLRAKELRSDGG